MCVCDLFFSFKDFERKDDDDDDDDDVENALRRSDSRGFFFRVLFLLRSESTRERDGEMPGRAGAG